MFKSFFKYQSLGNDFIVFDLFNQSEEEICAQLKNKKWPDFVKKICVRNFGVGADNVLIFKRASTSNIPELIIFNADGSEAENCLNGLRSVARHLYTHQSFQQKFDIKVGKHFVSCEIITVAATHSSVAATTPTHKNIEVVTKIKNILFLRDKKIKVGLRITEAAKSGTTLSGHTINVGNPHFVIFKQTNIDWLQKYGQQLATHPTFKYGTNVEFVWKDTQKEHTHLARRFKKYQMLVYERGCGITLSCGSGAAAATAAMFNQGKIAAEERICLSMSGGSLIAWVDKEKSVYLKAGAELIFSGKL